MYDQMVGDGIYYSGALYYMWVYVFVCATYVCMCGMQRCGITDVLISQQLTLIN